MASTLDYGIDWDRDSLMQLASVLRQVYWPISVFLVIPLVLFVLIRKTHMDRECKMAFVAHNAIHILFDVYNGLLYQAYTLMPYPVFCCTGSLCDANYSPRMLLTILACLTVSMCVPYLFVMLRVHQKMVSHDSPLKLSYRSQALIMLGITLLLASNVYGFGVWSQESTEKAEILETPNLAWLRNQSGNCLVLARRQGDLGLFGREMHLLLFTLLICFSFYVGLTYHAVFRISKQAFRSLARSRTYQLQLRFMLSMTIQALITSVMFVLPLAFLFILLTTPLADVMPATIMGLLRITLMVMYSCCSIGHSSVFLLKSTWCIQLFRKLMAQSKLSLEKRRGSTSSSFTIHLA